MGSETVLPHSLYIGQIGSLESSFVDTYLLSNVSIYLLLKFFLKHNKENNLYFL